MIGALKLLSQCSPGDLIRVSSEGRLEYALCAAASANQGYIILRNDPKTAELVRSEEDIAVISYGLNYILAEGLGNDVLTTQTAAGYLSLTISKSSGDSKTSLVYVSNQTKYWFDVQDGSSGSAPGGHKIFLAHWSIYLTVGPQQHKPVFSF